MAAERRTRFVRRADHLRALQPLVQHLACRLVLRPVVVREPEVAGLREVPIARPAPRQPRLRAAPDVSSDREHGAAGERPAQIWRRGLTFCFCGERLLVVIAAGRGCARGCEVDVVPHGGPERVLREQFGLSKAVRGSTSGWLEQTEECTSRQWFWTWTAVTTPSGGQRVLR